MPLNEMNTEKLHSTVKTVTDLLAQEAYIDLEKLSNGVRLTANELKKAVVEYGCKIVPTPVQGYEELDVIEVIGSKPKQWSVNVPVFTLEEGKSDLTLELTIIESPSALYRIEVDDLHVL
jgi:hypothetical protein